MLKVKQIKANIGYYLAGFADGEGSFMIIIRKRKDYKLGWKVSLAFNVSQKESYILSQFKKHLQCGKLRRRRSDDMYYYEVSNFTSIWENIIPFFRKFNFLSENKKFQFYLFRQVANIVHRNEHLTPEGFKKIVAIRDKMNRGGKSSRKNFKLNARKTTEAYLPSAEEWK